jgi:hypothetical protein
MDKNRKVKKLNGWQKATRKKTGHHTRTWNSEIGKPLEQRDEKRVEEFLPSRLNAVNGLWIWMHISKYNIY